MMMLERIPTQIPILTRTLIPILTLTPVWGATLPIAITAAIPLPKPVGRNATHPPMVAVRLMEQ
jgi:hypothetical protein